MHTDAIVIGEPQSTRGGLRFCAGCRDDQRGVPLSAPACF
jgi:hypothetical protein